MSEFNQPLYQKIYNYLVEKIKSGEYENGERIPSEKELAEAFEVSRITSKKALEMLAENGYIKRMRGKGSFVALDDEGGVDKEEAALDSKTDRFLIGLVIPDFSDTYGTGLLSGIEKEASENGFYVIPRRSYGRQDMEGKAIDDLVEMGVDGIIIMPVHGEHYSPSILRLVLDQFPIVLMDRYLKGIPAPFVGTDNVEAAKKATDYLLELGHRNIGFVSPPSIDTSTIEDRMEGYIKSHAEHGVVVDQSIWITDILSTIPGNNQKENIAADIEKIKNLLKNNPQVTCLFAVEYNIALIAMEAIKSLGKRVPQDISILCFDGPSNYTGEYFFTHIRQRETEMGSIAVKLLQEQIKHKNGNGKKFLDTDLIIGASTIKV